MKSLSSQLKLSLKQKANLNQNAENKRLDSKNRIPLQLSSEMEDLLRTTINAKEDTDSYYLSENVSSIYVQPLNSMALFAPDAAILDSKYSSTRIPSSVMETIRKQKTSSTILSPMQSTNKIFFGNSIIEDENNDYYQNNSKSNNQDPDRLFITPSVSLNMINTDFYENNNNNNNSNLKVSEAGSRLEILWLKRKAESARKEGNYNEAVSILQSAIEQHLGTNDYAKANLSKPTLSYDPNELLDQINTDCVIYDPWVHFKAAKIQRFYMKKFNKKSLMATKVGKIFRGFRIRKKYIKRRDLRRQCAILLQRRFRFHLIKMNKLATKIKVWYKLRKDVKAYQKRLNIYQMVRRIQRLFRGRKGRKIFALTKLRKLSAENIQRNARGYMKRSERAYAISRVHGIFYEAAVIIQNLIRKVHSIKRSQMKILVEIAKENIRNRKEKLIVMETLRILRIRNKIYFNSPAGQLHAQFIWRKKTIMTATANENIKNQLNDSIDAVVSQSVLIVIQRFDYEGLGCFRIKYLRAILNKLKASMSNLELLSLIEVLDPDNTGNISFIDFIEWYKSEDADQYLIPQSLSDNININWLEFKDIMSRVSQTSSHFYHTLVPLLSNTSTNHSLIHSFPEERELFLQYSTFHTNETILTFRQSHAPKYRCCQCLTPFVLFTDYYTHFSVGLMDKFTEITIPIHLLDIIANQLFLPIKKKWITGEELCSMSDFKQWLIDHLDVNTAPPPITSSNSNSNSNSNEIVLETNNNNNKSENDSNGSSKKSKNSKNSNKSGSNKSTNDSGKSSKKSNNNNNNNNKDNKNNNNNNKSNKKKDTKNKGKKEKAVISTAPQEVTNNQVNNNKIMKVNNSDYHYSFHKMDIIMKSIGNGLVLTFKGTVKQRIKILSIIYAHILYHINTISQQSLFALLESRNKFPRRLSSIVDEELEELQLNKLTNNCYHQMRNIYLQKLLVLQQEFKQLYSINIEKPSICCKFNFFRNNNHNNIAVKPLREECSDEQLIYFRLKEIHQKSYASMRVYVKSPVGMIEVNRLACELWVEACELIDQMSSGIHSSITNDEKLLLEVKAIVYFLYEIYASVIINNNNINNYNNIESQSNDNTSSHLDDIDILDLEVLLDHEFHLKNIHKLIMNGSIQNELDLNQTGFIDFNGFIQWILSQKYKEYEINKSFFVWFNSISSKNEQLIQQPGSKSFNSLSHLTFSSMREYSIINILIRMRKFNRLEFKLRNDIIRNENNNKIFFEMIEKFESDFIEINPSFLNELYPNYDENNDINYDINYDNNNANNNNMDDNDIVVVSGDLSNEQEGSMELNTYNDKNNNGNNSLSINKAEQEFDLQEPSFLTNSNIAMNPNILIQNWNKLKALRLHEKQSANNIVYKIAENEVQVEHWSRLMSSNYYDGRYGIVMERMLLECSDVMIRAMGYCKYIDYKHEINQNKSNISSIIQSFGFFQSYHTPLFPSEPQLQSHSPSIPVEIEYAINRIKTNHINFNNHSNLQVGSLAFDMNDDEDDVDGIIHEYDDRIPDDVNVNLLGEGRSARNNSVTPMAYSMALQVLIDTFDTDCSGNFDEGELTYLLRYCKNYHKEEELLRLFPQLLIRNNRQRVVNQNYGIGLDERYDNSELAKSVDMNDVIQVIQNKIRWRLVDNGRSFSIIRANNTISAHFMLLSIQQQQSRTAVMETVLLSSTGQVAIANSYDEIIEKDKKVLKTRCQILAMRQ
eukprot:gene11466-15358_t